MLKLFLLTDRMPCPLILDILEKESRRDRPLLLSLVYMALLLSPDAGDVVLVFGG
jgi:hypothetical protein